MEVEGTAATTNLPVSKLNELEELINDSSSSSTDIQEKGDAIIRDLKKQFRLVIADPHKYSKTPSERDFVAHMLEDAALFILKTGRLRDFTRAYRQLAPFYQCPGSSSSGSKQWLMVGLNLLSLLADGNVSGFHTELELIPSKIKSENQYILFVVNLEQSLMEGRYSNVVRLTAATAVPSPWYSCVLHSMKDAIRADVAACIEAAYDTLPVDDAMKFLFFEPSQKAGFEAFADERGWPVSTDGKVMLAEVKTRNSAGSASLSSEKLVRDSVAYSNELEKIV